MNEKPEKTCGEVDPSDDPKFLRNQIARLQEELRLANKHGVMFLKMPSTTYRHTVHHAFKPSATCAHGGNIWVSLDKEGDVEEVHVRLENGEPFVHDTIDFIEVLCSTAFQTGVASLKLVKQIPNARPDDGVLIYVFDWLRKQKKIIHDSKSDREPTADRSRAKKPAAALPAKTP